MKFQANGIITVTADIKDVDFSGDSSMLEVQVWDRGIGMSAEDKKRAFQPFQKSISEEAKNLNRHGNGVGLSICKQICENLDGDIQVQSMLGVGSKFTFRVKVYRTSEPKESPGPRTAAEANENSPCIGLDTHDMEIKLDSCSEKGHNRLNSNSPGDSCDTRALVRTGINEMDSFPPGQVANSKDRFSFQGLTFDMSTSLTMPLELIQGSSNIDEMLYGKLFEFLKTMESHGKLKPGESAGQVVLADDQYVTRE